MYAKMPLHLVGAMLLTIFFIVSCSQINTPQPQRDFTTLDLLLPVEKMPPGWEEVGSGPGPMSPDEGELGDSEVIFKPSSEQYNMADHFVWRFDTIEKAAKWYDRRFLSEFNSNSIGVDEPWRVPEGWTFTSPHADKFYAACTINNIIRPKQVCTAMWQYEEFVVVFASSIHPEYSMTVKRFEQIVGEIDRTMVEHLEK